MLGYLNDVWKYENDILKPIVEPVTIKIHGSQYIHILGKVTGRSIEVESMEVVINGIVEAEN
jgi:hypothetical protein